MSPINSNTQHFVIIKISLLRNCGFRQIHFICTTSAVWCGTWNETCVEISNKATIWATAIFILFNMTDFAHHDAVLISIPLILMGLENYLATCGWFSIHTFTCRYVQAVSVGKYFLTYWYNRIIFNEYITILQNIRNH